ncbi:MAG: hypothetical protein ACI9N9_002825 [Enterobacterales bacterium]|jgi:hypothetical protein
MQRCFTYIDDIINAVMRVVGKPPAIETSKVTSLEQLKHDSSE